MDDTAMMREALKLAQEAADDGEVPVGCVIVDAGGRIIGRGRNRRERKLRKNFHVISIFKRHKYKQYIVSLS